MSVTIRRTFPRAQSGSEPAGPVSYVVIYPDDALVNTVLDGRYRVVGRLGEGAMSTVYKAVHEQFGRTVAVKVLKKGLSMDPSSTKRFQREAKAISSLSHPNLIVVHDFGQTDTGQPYQVIEYLQGRSLTSLIMDEGPVEPSRAVALFVQICDAMQHAHDQGIIHRDLKPDNIMVLDMPGRQDVVKVVDFGIVKLTEDSQLKSQRLTMTGQVWGSPLYASPEQCLGKDLDHRSDIYSLGLVFYEALTGQPAVAGKNIGQIALKHLKERPPSMAQAWPEHNVPARLEEIVFKSVEKDPVRRFQSMKELRLALDSSLSAGPQRASGDRIPQRGVPQESAPSQKWTPPSVAAVNPAPTQTERRDSGSRAGVRPEAPFDNVVDENATPVRIRVEDVYAYQQGKSGTPSSGSLKSLRDPSARVTPSSLGGRFPVLPLVIAGVILAIALVVFALLASHMTAGK